MFVTYTENIEIIIRLVNIGIIIRRYGKTYNENIKIIIKEYVVSW